MTVNHVFEILLNYSKCGSWPQAIEQVLPKRKAPVLRGADIVGEDEEGDEEEEGLSLPEGGALLSQEQKLLNYSIVQ